MAFEPVIIQGVEATFWPPDFALDMKLHKKGDIGEWGNQKAVYHIWKCINSYQYIGITRTEWLAGNNFGLDYHSSIIGVYEEEGYYAPGAGSQKTDDPYGYLPRNGQSWEYNDDDNEEGRDLLGWDKLAIAVELPKTSVPATWQVSTLYPPYVYDIFITDPNCWRPGNDEFNQGITYDSGSVNPKDYYMVFTVYYQSRDFGWWSCYGGTYADSASKWFKLVQK